MDFRNVSSKERADTVDCTPIPSWVEHEPYAGQAPEAADYVFKGICRLLNETQIDLCGSDLAWHCRTAQRVVTRAGAEQIAQFNLEYDPSFQRLEIHFIRIVRDQAPIEHAKREALQILRRETSLERLTLTGVLTVSLLIPDVRIDDVLEISFTVYGSRPLFGGKYAGWLGFDPFAPWFDARCRVLRPLRREISTKRFNEPPKPTTIVKDNIEDSRWRLIGQERRMLEPFTPPWLIQAPVLQQSEFRTWHDVAGLFAPFYETTDIPDALAAEVDRLAETHLDDADRAAEWLRFVQRKLRYFALALGEGGLVPRDPETIWSTRFGDCKDAALLYAAGARRMGLDACVALSSTSHGAVLDQFLPSPSLFNHCIVRLRLNDKSYWLDPTLQPQAGSLENIYQAHSGWALPLTRDTAELERLGTEEPLHLTHCECELRFGPKRGSPATLQITMTHRSWAADALRNMIANGGMADYAKQLLIERQEAWPGTLETRPVTVHDDPVKNCLTTNFSYEIRDCWKSGGKRALNFKFVDTVASSELQAIKGAERRADIYLGRPRKVTSRVRMHMPCTWTGSSSYRELHEQGLHYVSRLAVDGRTVRSAKELVVGAWSVPAPQIESYGRVVAGISQNVLMLNATEWLGRIRPSGWYRRYAIFLYYIFVFGFLAFIFLLIGRSN